MTELSGSCQEAVTVGEMTSAKRRERITGVWGGPLSGV